MKSNITGVKVHIIIIYYWTIFFQKEPYKTISKGSLAQRAIDAGLQYLADKVLNFEPVILALDKPANISGMLFLL